MYSRRKIREPEDFISENNDRQAFWEKKGFMVASLFSTVWLAFIFDYVFYSGWWSSRYDLSPAEFVGSFCGLFLPIVIAFLLSNFVDHSGQSSVDADYWKELLNEIIMSPSGTDYTKSLTAALRMQIKEFRSVFAQVNKETVLVRDDLKQWIGDLSKIIKHVDTKTISSIREIADHVQNLTAMTEKANDATEETLRLFADQVQSLTVVTEESRQKIGAVSLSLQNQTSDVQNLAHAMETANNRTNEAIKTAGLLVQNMDQSGKEIETVMQKYAADLTQHTQKLYTNLEKILSVFKNQGVLLDNEVQQTANRIGVLEESLGNNADGMIQKSAAALKELSLVNNAFEETILKIQKTITTIKTDVESIETAVKETVQKATTVFPSAKKQAQADLLQDATVILNHLQSFSVDMAHIFTPKSEDGLWQKYYDGDKAVFMRHITKMISESQHKKIIEFYKQNEDFRLAVARYMSEFEGMTKKASESEESNLLMSVLIGSDVGRLYMVLADVLKKEL